MKLRMARGGGVSCFTIFNQISIVSENFRQIVRIAQKTHFHSGNFPVMEVAKASQFAPAHQPVRACACGAGGNPKHNRDFDGTP
jgi:hypothetical protein